jgi:hypothetical protein
MVKRTNKQIINDKDKINRNSNIIDYSSQTIATAKILSPDNNDDLILTLADAYENQRARQVFEWECTRRKIYQQAA